MYAEVTKNKTEIKYVIDNLCPDAVVELKAMYGDTYKEIIFEEIEHQTTDTCLIKLKLTNEPVGVFGVLLQSSNSLYRTAGIFLLTTNNLHKGNITTFLKGAKKQINKWQNEYSLIMDRCYKKNLIIQKWLKLLGFKPSQYQDNDFQVYYKGNIGLYKE